MKLQIATFVNSTLLIALANVAFCQQPPTAKRSYQLIRNTEQSSVKVAAGHVGAFVMDGSRAAVLLDGAIVGSGYDRLASLPFQAFQGDRGADKSMVFSADYESVLYLAEKDGQARFHLNGVPVGSPISPQDEQLMSAFVWSPAKRRFAYVLKTRSLDSAKVIVDGQASASSYKGVENLQFSADGSRYGFIAGNEPASIVIDGRVIETCYHASSLSFSPDSKHFAYICRKQGNQSTAVPSSYVAIDGKPDAGRYSQIGQFAWADSAPAYAYVATRNDTYAVIFNGKELPGIPPKATAIPVVALSPNGSRIGAVAVSGQGQDQFQLVIDGKPSPVYSHVGPVEFSPDSVHYAARATSQFTNDFLLLDGVEYPALGAPDMVSTRTAQCPLKCRTVFIGTSSQYLLPKRNGTGWDLMLAGVSDRPESVAVRGAWKWGQAEIVISKDGSRFGYSGETTEDRKTIIDGRILPRELGPMPGAYTTGAMMMSPDGRNIAFLASVSRGPIQRNALVLGNRALTLEGSIENVTFSDDGQHLAFFGAKDNKRALFLNGKPIWFPPPDIRVVAVSFSATSLRVGTVKTVRPPGLAARLEIEFESFPLQGTSIGDIDSQLTSIESIVAPQDAPKSSAPVGGPVTSGPNSNTNSSNANQTPQIGNVRAELKKAGSTLRDRLKRAREGLQQVAGRPPSAPNSQNQLPPGASSQPNKTSGMQSGAGGHKVDLTMGDVIPGLASDPAVVDAAKKRIADLCNEAQQNYSLYLAIPTNPNSNPKARRTGFRREAEQQSERSDAGVLIVG